MATTFDLSGKSILITGAGRGLGRALAIGACASRARRSLPSISMRSALAELRRSFPAIATQVVDVVDRAAFAAAALRIGRIDAVVNNAMLIRYDPIEAVDEAILDRMLAIGIKGADLGRAGAAAPDGSGGRRRRAEPRLAHRRARLSEHRRLQHGQGRNGHADPNAGRRARPAARCASTPWRRAPFPRPARSPSRRRRSTRGARRASRCGAWVARRTQPRLRCTC